MKVLLRNIGMTLHLIHKLRARGLDAAVKRSVHHWRFIDSVAARIDEPALHHAQTN